MQYCKTLGTIWVQPCNLQAYCATWFICGSAEDHLFGDELKSWIVLRIQMFNVGLCTEWRHFRAFHCKSGCQPLAKSPPERRIPGHRKTKSLVSGRWVSYGVLPVNRPGWSDISIPTEYCFLFCKETWLLCVSLNYLCSEYCFDLEYISAYIAVLLNLKCHWDSKLCLGEVYGF